MVANKWEALLDTSLNSGWTITLTDGGGVFSFTPSGEFYLSSVGNGTRNLLDEIAYLATAGTSGGLTYSASLDSTTGKVTISADGSFDMNFVNGASIQPLLGFTFNPTGASTYTGLNASEAVWLPHTTYDGDYGVGDEGWYESDDAGTIAPDGTSYHVGYNKRVVNRLTYDGLLERHTRTAAETITNESLQTFWDNTIYGEATWSSRGNAWRIYWDSTNDSSYATYRVKNTQQFKPIPKVRWVGVYTFTLELAKLVS